MIWRKADENHPRLPASTAFGWTFDAGSSHFSPVRCLNPPALEAILHMIIGIPSPAHSFTLGLNPSFSANPPHRSLSFFSYRIHYMDFPDCLLLLLSISVFLLFSFFSVFTLFSCRFRAVD